jgi:hypothetical protein
MVGVLLIGLLNPDMTPYRMSLDGSVSPKENEKDTTNI